MKVAAFDFDLADELIALHPAAPRDASRLLVVPGSGILEDRRTSDLADHLRPGDALVLNDTRVIPAALEGVRLREGAPGARVAFNLNRRLAPDRWQAFARPAKRLRAGDTVRFGRRGEGQVCGPSGLEARVESDPEGGEVILRFETSGPDLDQGLADLGDMPLPPYIASRRAPGVQDRSDYQTIYASQDGAVAAPTAGLHFTPELFARLDAKGVSRHFVTLHVGAGTFLPMRGDTVEAHDIHAEWGTVPADVAEALNRTRGRGGRIVAVGTTSLRILETAADAHGHIAAFSGDTNLFLKPGYRFRTADLLLTNFHLPKSSLFVLVAAYAGLEPMKAAYAHAIAGRYRFYSYGDACLLECTAHV
ncbi:S-adenosylmethionine:tRNA ribosyltransferase-isomerase [hydrothermal vent metagenome]|uniref:S-adenosylmethionine:tRNA ribosyltransferase-isomerase n=1 Tax=hydrothermal vent metagenome TaxID=652676 RepID=A0A3B0T907_9ZZZZ